MLSSVAIIKRPSWANKLVDADGSLRGPALGPSASSALKQLVEMTGEDPITLLSAWLSRPVSLDLLTAYASGEVDKRLFYAGHTGYMPISTMAYPAFKMPSFVYGPSPGCASVVVVGLHPASDEELSGYLFSGPSGQQIKLALATVGVENFLDDAYFTNVCRFVPPGNKMKGEYVKECAWFTWAEVTVIQPRLLILLGAEALKFFFPRGALTKLRSTLLDVPGFPNTKAIATNHPAYIARVPAALPGFAADLRRAYSYLSGAHLRSSSVTNYEADLEGAILRTPQRVGEYVDECLTRNDLKFSLDCEWAGKSVWARGKLLSLQIAREAGHAVLIPFHQHPRVTMPTKYDSRANGQYIVFHPHRDDCEKYGWDSDEELLGWPCGGGYVEVLNHLVPSFDTAAKAEVVAHLRRLLERPGVRVGGHNFPADYPWIKDLGIDLVFQWLDGFDTMLKHHKLHESTEQNLTSCLLKYTDLDRYDVGVHSWMDLFANLTKYDNTGYLLVYESMLYLYALYDADGTFRLDTQLDAELDSLDPKIASQLRNIITTDMEAGVAIMEIEATGIPTDRDRILELAAAYEAKLKELVAALCEKVNWPEFNHRSVFQCRELLFGEELNGKKRTDPNTPVRIRPEGAHCCNLMPVKSTSKPALDWEKVVAAGDTRKHSPSTDKESLGILSARDPIANELRKIRFVDQVIKMYVSTPYLDPDTGEMQEAGLIYHIDHDGRIRTHILQLTETGRWKSSRPNLQNAPKRREPQLLAMFAEGHKPKSIRSVFMAPPGWVLIESDYKQAELITLAVLCGDMNFYRTLTELHTYEVLVDIKTRAVVAWAHPTWFRPKAKLEPGEIIKEGVHIGEICDVNGWRPYFAISDLTVDRKLWERDLHAEGAISSFRMPYSGALHGPPKEWIESVAPDKRVAQKTVNFGIPYGRMAFAVYRELRQDGVNISVDECEVMREAYFNSYPLTVPFFQRCADSVRDPRYLQSAFGRLRHFFPFDDESKMAQQEREAYNFPIQSPVADCLNKAAANAWFYRLAAAGDANALRRFPGIADLPPIEYKILLGVHDAMIFACPVESIDVMVRPNGLIDICMSQLAKIPLPDRACCNGLYSNVQADMFPYRLDVDKSIYLRWGEKPTPADLGAIGVPEKYWPKKKK